MIMIGVNRADRNVLWTSLLLLVQRAFLRVTYMCPTPYNRQCCRHLVMPPLKATLTTWLVEGKRDWQLFG